MSSAAKKLADLRRELQAACENKDAALAKYVDYDEAVSQTQMQMDMGVKKAKAIAASVEAVLFTAKQTAKAAKAAEAKAAAEREAQAKDEAARAQAKAEKEKLDLEAAEAALVAEQAAAMKEMQQRAFEAFNLFDTKGNGVIDAEEMLAILTRSTSGAKPMTVDDAREFISSFDDNGDVSTASTSGTAASQMLSVWVCTLRRGGSNTRSFATPSKRSGHLLSRQRPRLRPCPPRFQWQRWSPSRRCPWQLRKPSRSTSHLHR